MRIDPVIYMATESPTLTLELCDTPPLPLTNKTVDTVRHERQMYDERVSKRLGCLAQVYVYMTRNLVFSSENFRPIRDAYRNSLANRSPETSEDPDP